MSVSSLGVQNTTRATPQGQVAGPVVRQDQAADGIARATLQQGAPGSDVRYRDSRSLGRRISDGLSSIADYFEEKFKNPIIANIGRVARGAILCIAGGLAAPYSLGASLTIVAVGAADIAVGAKALYQVFHNQGNGDEITLVFGGR